MSSMNCLHTPRAGLESRAAVAWLAIIALLFHMLLPAGLLIGTAMLNPAGAAAKLTLCSAASDNDVPGQAKPGLSAHYCALCATPAAEESALPAGLIVNSEISAAIYPRGGSDWTLPVMRQCRMQARAPPALA
jgi:hypothetical protein